MSDSLYDHLFKIVVFSQDSSLSRHVDWLITENEPKEIRKAFGIETQFKTIHTEDFDVRLHIWQFQGTESSFKEIKEEFFLNLKLDKKKRD